ncbi:hypothetical protein K438DRAFT_1967427 [Mycena galopus ATCC 62051]|nr:hypothetical protein K438DRAFT_1967427 [Mycena galopus ATCC 62051]
MLTTLAPLESTELAFDSLSISMASSSESSVSSSTSESFSTSETSEDWSDILGSDWWHSSNSSASSLDSDSSLSSSDSADGMPELRPVGYPDSDDEDDTGSDSDTSESSSSGMNGDDEGGWSDLDDMEVDDGQDFAGRRTNHPLRWVRHNLEERYSQRYEMPRDSFPRGPAFLRHILGPMKDSRPDLFRQELRVSPLTFDQIVAKIADDPVFANNSSNAQMPVEDQLAIALFRFGHSGNAAGLQKVANWAGVGKGTITLVTRRVMTAVLRPDFMSEAVRMPTAVEKEDTKAWVEAHSCKGWCNGWCMVDGTLVPLFDRPFWFGESYFDRKCNYSLNIQVCTSALYFPL